MSYFKKILFAKNYLAVYLFCIIIFNIVLLNYPLTNVFGFEFSALNSMLLVLLSGFYVITLLKKESGANLSAKFKNNLLLAVSLFLIIPAFISIIHSILTISCSFYDGLMFYFVITFPSVLIGSALGMLTFLYIKRLTILIFIVVYILILFIPILEFYFNPQVYFFNPIFGYYPGTVYDVAIKISLKLIGYRILNVLFFGLIAGFSFIIIKKKRIARIIFIFLILIISTVFIYISPVLGYSTTFSRLNSVLNNEVETPHFSIHFSSGIDKNLVKVISLYHEYYYAELEKFFKYKLTRKINSYIFLNSDQKGKLFGSKNADMAKPWQYSIYVTYNDYNSILKHELAHSFSVKFGTGIFEVAKNLNPSLIEGIAVAADPFYDDNTIDYMAALAYKNNYRISLRNLYTGFNFFGQTSSLSYVYAGSFTKYLVEKYGIEKFERLYVGLNFNEVYGKPLNQLSKGFYRKLDNINASDKKDEADYYYGRKAIFYKVCPRYVAAELSDAWSAYYRNEYDKSKNMFEEILNTGDNYSALIGMANSLEKLNKRHTALILLKSKLKYYKNTAYYYSIEFSLADLFATLKNYTKADSIYYRIVKQNPNRRFYNLSNLRLSLSQKDSLLYLYLKGNEFNKYLVLEKLNSVKLNFYSVPVAITIAKSLDEEYGLFLKQYYRVFTVKNYAGSYAMYKLSQYMVENFDFKRALKIAKLSLLYQAGPDFSIILKNNYNAINWLNKNSHYILKKFIF